MSQETFKPTADWPLQEIYKRDLHEQIQRWGTRVAPMFEAMPDEERQPKEKFFEFLVTSVERGDHRTANVVQGVDSYVRSYLENGPYVGGGSIDSDAGYELCQYQFEGLYTIFEAGRLAAES